MTTQHTKGRLTDDERGHGVITGEQRQTVATTNTPADSRRLVACWNACEGIETEALECHALQVIAAERFQKVYDATTRRGLCSSQWQGNLEWSQLGVLEMTDTVTRLMELADDYADRPEFPETRQALEAELVRLFTPLSDEQIQEAATLAVKRKELNWAGFSEDGYGAYTIPVLSTSHMNLIRIAEKAHGIGGES